MFTSEARRDGCLWINAPGQDQTSQAEQKYPDFIYEAPRTKRLPGAGPSRDRLSPAQQHLGTTGRNSREAGNVPCGFLGMMREDLMKTQSSSLPVILQ